MIFRAILASLAAVQFFGSASAQNYTTWCGKNILPGQPVVFPKGEFRLPETSTKTLLAFRCSPALRPYVEGEDTTAGIIIDTPVTYKKIEGAEVIELSNSQQELTARQNGGAAPNFNETESLSVTVSTGGRVLAEGIVNINGTGAVLNFNLTNLEARLQGYEITCEATYNGSTPAPSTYSTTSTLLYLPSTTGSIVKTDLESGALMTTPANGTGKDYSYTIPYGFYADFTYFANNLSSLAAMKSQGFNVIHPIPPYSSSEALESIFSTAEKEGLYVIYDMRDIYQNLTAVAEVVSAYKSLPNLLSWYTAHEADGNSYPASDTDNAYQLIYTLDGYHPVSIVLNCQDYYFEEYANGADIIAEDAYPIGINATWSKVYDTPCNKEFGHCGCDNCVGSQVDIRSRIGSFAERLEILGWERSKSLWIVPQAFGSVQYWDTTPTGQEWAGMHVVAMQHGAKGAVSFSYPTTNGSITTIEGTANGLAVVLDIMEPFLSSDIDHFTPTWYEGVDLGLWKSGAYTYLLTGVNINGTELSIPWEAVGIPYETLNTTTQVSRSFSVSQNINATGLNFRPGGIGVYVIDISNATVRP